MAIKATVCKAVVDIADIDRGVYATQTLTLARQPSETDERMMMRLLAWALQLPASDRDGPLLPAQGMADADEPDLWQHGLDGRLRLWVEVGLPDERRLVRAAGRADRVALYAYGSSAASWWAGARPRLERLSNLSVWQLPAAQSQALATLAGRSMQLQVNVQEGQVWVGDGQRSVELDPQTWLSAGA